MPLPRSVTDNSDGRGRKWKSGIIRKMKISYSKSNQSFSTCVCTRKHFDLLRFMSEQDNQ